MNHLEDRDEFEAWLALLPPTTKFTRRMACLCPVAGYLQAVTGKHVIVGRHVHHVGDDTYPNPLWVRPFLDDVDAGSRATATEITASQALSTLRRLT